MGLILRHGDVRDVQALCGPMTRRRQLAMLQQARESELFTIADEENGRPLVAGGFFPWDDTRFEEAWMVVSAAHRPSARVFVEAVGQVLMSRDSGRAIVALIDVKRPRDQRFAAFVGFESGHCPPVYILGRDFDMMIWRP